VLRSTGSGLALGTAVYAAAAGRMPQPRRPEGRERPLLAAAVCSSVAEELLWRGVLLRSVRRGGTLAAVAVTSAGFAAAHRPRAAGRALVTHLVLAGALGVVALRRGGLAAAAVAHTTYNLLVLLDDAPP
jgi:membrane protease YdiL (CAAX protease family)